MDKLFWQDLSAALMLSFGHFLWIGALIAMATALVVRQQRTSARRYQSWLAGFAVMALSPVITLLVLQGIDPASNDIVTQPTPAPSNSPPVAVAKPDPPGEVGSQPPGTDLTTLTVPLDLPPAATPTALDARPRLATERRESAWWRAYAPLVTYLYLMGVALLGLRLLVGLWGGRRLQRRAIPITESSLLFALHRQAVAMGMKCKPVLAYCERVTVPTVLGILTPTILLPISVMSGLTPEQIESVLAHELAHLRRCDHIVNLLQRVVESLLFFHPAVWWVSRCIRDEREHCCDDLVIACGAVPLEYAQSLLRVAELSREAELHKSNQRRSFTAVSLLATGDRPSTLRQRVGRLLGYQTDLNVRVVRPWSLVGLAIGCLCIVGMLTSMTWIAVAEINHVDPEPVVEHAPTIAIADLPQGVKVEFVGLTRMNEEDRTWWTPDGVDLTPIPKLPVGHGKFSISQNGKAVDVRRFLIHVYGVDDFKSIAVSASGTNVVEQDSAGRQFVSFSGVLGPADSTLRVGVATEPISPKRILDAKGIRQPLASDAPQDSVAEDIVVTSVEPFSPIKAESIVHTTLHYEMPAPWKQVDLRIVAVDKSGTEHHSATIGSKQPEPNASIWKHSVTFPLPPDQVDRFEYQFRLYRHCAIFKNIAQNAGDRTQLAISTELIPERAPPPAVDPPAKQPFAAELPNGIRLELSGVLNGTDKGPAAWSPDGSPMVVPKEWPKLLRGKDQNPTRGFVFRSQGLVKGQGIVWRLTGRWVTPILSETVPEYVGISSNLEDRTVKLRVGITDTWGPWQRVEPDGSIKARVEVTSQFRDVYSRVKSALIIGGQEGGTSELRTGFVLGIDETDDQAEYESVAVDREGKRHDRQGVDSWKKKTIPFYSLPLSQIDHFEFRLQPHLHWVTFDNVSLIPGEQTEVKVTAEVKQAQPKEIVGMVRLVDSARQLVEITLGLADGVKVGDRFDVHDGKKVNDSWKGRIEVIQVAQDSAVARIRELRANQRVTKSDRVVHASESPVETVVGTVVSPDGQVVPGIEVLAFQGAIQLDHKFVTDARGEFRVPKAWRDVDHWLTVVARDGRDRLGWFDFMIHGHSDKGQKAEDGSFRLVLLPMSRTVHGRVVDESGMPLAQIPIQINQLDHDVNSTAVHWKYQKLGDAPLVAGAITDNDGRYELKLPSDTTAWLSTNHPDWADERIRASSENDLGQTKLLRAARISGRIIDSRTGTPLPAVGVTAIATRTDFLQSSGGDAMTDAQGNYVISGLRHGEYTIQVLPGHESILTAPAYEKVTLKSGETFVADFPLTVGKRLAGRVLDSTTGEPIPNCKVTCTGPSAPASALRTETNERGEFEFRVSPGINAVDAREGRIFGADSERKINVAVDGNPEPVVLKVGPMTPAVPGQKIKIFMGRPLDRKVTVDFQKKPLAEVLAAICTEAGMTLELDEDGLSAAGTSKDIPVTLVEPKPVTLQRALMLIVASHEKLAYLVGKHRVYVSSRELVDARKRLLESGDFPENDRF